MAHVVDAARRERVQPPPGLGGDVVDHGGDEAPVRLVEQPRAVDAGMSAAHLLQSACGNRHLGEIGEGEERGPVAVINIVTVIGDVVGERGGLSFDGSEGGKIEILPRTIGEDRLRHRLAAPRPSNGPLCLTIPSSVSKVRFNPSKLAYFLSSSVTTRKDWALWSNPPFPAMAASRARSPAWPKGGWPRSCARASASVRSSSSSKRAGKRAGDLRHFETMGEPRAVMVALVIDEDLGLVVQPAEGGRVEDAVAVAAEGRAGRARGLIVEPAAARPRIGGIGREPSPRAGTFPSPSPAWSIDKPVRHPMFQVEIGYTQHERTVHHLERASGSPDRRALERASRPRPCSASASKAAAARASNTASTSSRIGRPTTS